MTKQEFINFLNIKADESGLTKTSWKRTFINSENYWTLYHPTIEWMEDKMDLSEDGLVKIIFFESIYDDPKCVIMSYDEFISDYSKSVSLF